MPDPMNLWPVFYPGFIIKVYYAWVTLMLDTHALETNSIAVMGRVKVDQGPTDYVKGKNLVLH